MAGLGTTEILIILLVVLLLFGSTKLPQLARSLGRSARILKTETQGLHSDDPDDRPASSAPEAHGVREPAARPRDADTRPGHQAAPQPRAGQQASLPPAQTLRGTTLPAESDAHPAK
ncbi:MULTISPECIES: Sec-independent protein translocase subunit TatA [unclassified Spirillospora]|uniref:Sec-independent protein translocase subunit TatA n=1 Tax=unclassified Spirillospora TaxID=2642701 RepID=UPI00371A1CCA